ncbi:SufD family Fe-S cluster assembly protein [Companilactobacillus jidongensis]|uniref:SufD family Fe-S cluster assembly protein n=1 Tax=Companilactobacillus jidongensis TaxID=2486006 RepID=UPI000F79B1C4|nr:SufD family Fe-S cluster assembly protein [Companilactobacillus jidongensis]
MKINNEFLEDFELDANDHGEPHWFIDRRISALKQLDKLDLPVSKYFTNEDILIKLTSPQRIRSKKNLIDSEKITGSTISQFGQTVIKNDLPEELEAQGVVLTDIFTALRIHPRLIQKNLMDKVISPDEDKITAFHLACINSGIFLYVPKDVKLTEPIKIDLIQDDTKKGDLNTHALIVAENDSAVTVEQTLSNFGDNQNNTNLFVEVLSRANAKVNYSLKSESNSKLVYLRTRAYLSRKAEVDWDMNLANQKDTWADFSDNLFGADSHINLDWTSNESVDKITEISTSFDKHGMNSSITMNGQKY